MYVLDDDGLVKLLTCYRHQDVRRHTVERGERTHRMGRQPQDIARHLAEAI